MFKLTGSIIVLLSATLFGIKKYSDIFERKKILSEIRDGSVQVENMLRCMCAPLHESFLWGGSFFERASEKISYGMLPAEAVWETASKLPLDKEDLRIIKRFSEGLSARDCQGQVENIKLFIKELDGAIKNASDELSTRGKLYIKGSILAAMAFVLMIV